MAGQVAEVTLDHPPTGFGVSHTVPHPARRPIARTRAWIDYRVETLPALGENGGMPEGTDTNGTARET